MIEKPAKDHEGLVRCPVCEYHFKREEGFICSRCRRGILCKRHRVTGTKECSSCVIERRHKELSDLREQERSLKGFLRLLQFVFLVFAVFFIALKIGLEDTVEFLKNSFMIDILPYVGGGAFLGYIVVYFVLNSQKEQSIKLENVIRKMRLAGK